MQKIISNPIRTVTLTKLKKGYEVRVEKDGAFYTGKLFSKYRDALPVYKEYEKISCGVCGGIDEPIVQKCCMCSKQLCGKCTAEQVYYTTIGPFPYCQRCYDIGEPYIERLLELDEISGKVHDEWKTACRQEAA